MIAWPWTALVAVVSAALTSAGMVPLIKGWFERKVTAASVVDQLSDTALEMLRQARIDANAIRDEARAEVREARTEAHSARLEANEARREAVAARIEAMRAAASMRAMIDAILNPYASLEELRKMVQREGPS